MRKRIVGILIVCLYCFPFVYFSMLQDFANGSMLGYLIMIVVTSLLAYFGKLYKSSILVIVGNILSMGVSFYCISGMNGNERWGGYFKPLAPYQLLVLVSFLNVFPQLIAMRLARKKMQPS